MEQLLHYVWKHKLLPAKPLFTTDGLPVEIIDTGLHNRNAGPDFFNAKVKIGGTLWVGNVEIHLHSSDWYLHRHNYDEAYNNVVLHVVATVDADVVTADGRRLPQLQIDIPEQVASNYEELCTIDQYPPCYQIIPELSPLMIHSWMSALQTERLEQKTQAIADRVRQCGGAWEAAYFTTLARNFGFGVNGDAFETWARHLPLQAVGHHRDDLFQIEAIFFGQAGLLTPEAIPERHREQALSDGYFTRLRSEYQYLARKFTLQPMDYKQWRFLRLRPQNFPHVRLSQLASLYYHQRSGLSQLLDCTTIGQATELLHTEATSYWHTHYGFGSESNESRKQLSNASLNLLLINTGVPMLFAYGRHHGNEQLCDRAFDFLEQLRPERNHIVSMWQRCGLEVRSAGDTQALIQLKRAYCEPKNCLKCRIGYEYLSAAVKPKTPHPFVSLLSEPNLPENPESQEYQGLPNDLEQPANPPLQ